MSAQVTPDASDSRSSTSPLPEPPDETPAGCKPAAATAPAAAHSSVSALGEGHVVREYTVGEEIANSISHGIGIVLALAALPFLAVRAAAHPESTYLVAALVYAYSMLLEYTMSTLYHAIAVDKAKKVFKVLDHSCIYLFIAGSYTPFCLISLADSGGLWLCAFVWAVALAGVVLGLVCTALPARRSGCSARAGYPPCSTCSWGGASSGSCRRSSQRFGGRACGCSWAAACATR